jgi:hypothetical protein
MLKFGRDSHRPLKLTLAIVINEQVSVSITYPIATEGCNDTEAWFRDNLTEAATADGLTQPPAFSEANWKWGFMLRKEGHSFRAVIYEKMADGTPCDTPEHTGLPTLTLYGPIAQIKIKAFSMAGMKHAWSNFTREG